MKYVVFFLLVCVALAAAAPQLISPWGGLIAPGVVPAAPATLVAGPTVVNNPLGWGGRYITPGVIGATYL